MAESASGLRGGLIRDKRGILTNLPSPRDLTLELGCGPTKSDPQAIGIDRLDSQAVDIVGDVEAVLARLPDASVGRVVSSHFLEHVDDLDALIGAIARVLTNGGTLDATVPHFSNPYYYSDATHRRPFGLYSMAYMAECKLFRREVPRYGKDFGLELVDVHLAFNSHFYVRRMLKRVLTRAVNRTRWLQELYEESFAYFVPCYEVRYTLRRTSRPFSSQS